MTRKGQRVVALLALKVLKEGDELGMRSLKSGKGKEMDSSKETPERNAALTIACS